MDRDTSRPPKRVVKLYGFENVLLGMNLFINAVMTTLGLWQVRDSDAVRRAEADAQRMIARGYRIVSAEHCELPVFRIGYERVTYELVAQEDAPSGSSA